MCPVPGKQNAPILATLQSLSCAIYEAHILYAATECFGFLQFTGYPPIAGKPVTASRKTNSKATIKLRKEGAQSLGFKPLGDSLSLGALTNENDWIPALL
jgi:hypothetical protein